MVANGNANPHEDVGYSGTGWFTQSGGMNICYYFNLGYGNGSSGSYNLSGSGNLSAQVRVRGLGGNG